MLDMISTVIKYLSPEKENMISKVVFIVAVWYAPAFLKSTKPEHVVLTYLNVIKISKAIQLE